MSLGNLFAVSLNCASCGLRNDFKTMADGQVLFREKALKMLMLHTLCPMASATSCTGSFNLLYRRHLMCCMAWLICFLNLLHPNVRCGLAQRERRRLSTHPESVLGLVSTQTSQNFFVFNKGIISASHKNLKRDLVHLIELETLTTNMWAKTAMRIS